MRNEIRFLPRELLIDEVGRKKLDKTVPINYNFEELVDKKIRKYEISRDEALLNILDTARKSNEIVDKSLGLERKDKDYD